MRASALLVCILAACGPSAGELDAVCTAYDEATGRLAEWGDTIVMDAVGCGLAARLRVLP